MPSPVTPAEFAALIPDANATICDVMKLFWQMAVKYAIYDAYKYQEVDGEIVLTTEYKNDLCRRIREAGNCGALASRIPTMTPLSNTELRALIPKATDPLCLKTQPGMINWMNAVSDRVAWEESADFLQYLCSLPCLGGGNDACPDVFLSVTHSYTASKVTLNINASGIRAGTGEWNYTIYRSEIEGDFTDPGAEIHTGTTTQSAITYDDETVVADTEYFYKVVVDKDGCGEEFSVETDGITPSACTALTTLTFGITPGPVGSSRMTLTAAAPGIGIPDGSAFNIYRSTSPDEIGTLIKTGAIGDGSADGVDANGRRQLQYNDDFPTAVCGTRYYYTVSIKQGETCTEYVSNAGSLSGVVVPGGDLVSLGTFRNVGTDQSPNYTARLAIGVDSINTNRAIKVLAWKPGTNFDVNTATLMGVHVFGTNQNTVEFPVAHIKLNSGNSSYQKVKYPGQNYYTITATTTLVAMDQNNACPGTSNLLPVTMRWYSIS